MRPSFVPMVSPCLLLIVSPHTTVFLLISIAGASLQHYSIHSVSKMAEHVDRMEVLAFGAAAMLYWPCSGCGRRTGGFCDTCFAIQRYPEQQWASHQRTSVCGACDQHVHGRCHFCRGHPWVTPPPTGKPVTRGWVAPDKRSQCFSVDPLCVTLDPHVLLMDFFPSRFYFSYLSS